MNIKELKEDIELKIKIATKTIDETCKINNFYYWQKGYLKACEEALKDLKEVKEGISISPDLIMSAKELHKGSLMAPSAFLLAWNELFFIKT